MTIWYCRPAGAHGNTQNGQSYDTAWLGWSAVVWGGSGVVGGDTLYLCGAHESATTLSIGNHGATSVTGKTVVRGDYSADQCLVTFTAVGAYISLGRDYTELRGVSITHSVVATNTCVYVNASNIDVRECDIEKGVTGVNIVQTSGKTDILIEGNHIHDLIGVLGTSGRGVSLAKTTGSITHARITIRNNVIERCVDRSIHIVTNDSVWSTSPNNDITIEGNTFRDNGGSCVLILCPSDGVDHVPVSSNVIMRNNEAYDNGTPAGDNGTAGNISVRGASNVLIEGNKVWRCTAQGAGIQTAYNRNITIRNNDIRNITSGTQTAQFQSGLPIDANGIFFDNFTDGGVAYGNHISDLAGTGHVNSGVGLAFWQARNCRYYGNLVERVQRACSYGAAEETGNHVLGNTFIDCSRGVHKVGTNTLLGTISISNNVIIGAAGADYGMYSVGNASATWSNNALTGFATTYSGFSAGSGDITSDPLLNPDGTLQPGSPCIGAGKALDIPTLAYDGRPFATPPSIGAMELRKSTSRQKTSIRSRVYTRALREQPTPRP